jgi:integrase
MAYAEKLVKSWRACWYVPGRKNAVKESGFPTKKAAEDYAAEQEVLARQRGTRGDAHQINFRAWAEEWFSGIHLEPATMRNYRSVLTNHLLRQWGDWKMADLAHADAAIATWKNELLGSYADGTVNGIMGKLVTILGDAVDQGIIHRNPALAKRRRGKIAPKRKRQRETRYEEITDPVGALLIAERAAFLSGRPDEFILLTAKYWLGLRWGETIGLTAESVNTSFHLRKQLYEHTRKRFYWKEPKAGSERMLDVPPFLVDLLDRQARDGARQEATGRLCPCGEGLPKEYRHETGIHLFTGVDEAHQRANPFRSYLFGPAAQGLYYAGQSQEFPVYYSDADDPWSIVPTGKGVRQPANPAGQWKPIREGMKPHGLRHSHKVVLEELGTPKVLMDDRMGHVDQSTSARYSHVTPSMRRDLVDGLQERWEKALAQRAAMNFESPVPLVNALLDAHSRSTPDPGSRRLTSRRGMVA